MRRGIPTGPPTSYISRHRYVTSRIITPGSGAVIGQHTFGANDIYDPDKTGVGHQPMFVDQICAMGWDFWFVLRSRIKVTAIYPTNTETVGMYIGVILAVGGIPQPTLGTEGTMDQAMLEYTEYNSGARRPMLAGNALSRGNDRRVNITHSYDAKKFWKLDTYSDLYSIAGEYGLCSSAGPTQGPSATNSVNYTVWSATMVGNEPSATAQWVRIELEYDVLWMRDTVERIIQS